MKLKRITYIGLISLLAVSCVEGILGSTSPDTGKTPLEVTALMGTKAPATKAVDKEFAEGDVLLAYLRHVTWDGSTGARSSVAADQAPKLVTFTKGSDNMAAYDGSDITPIGLGATLGLTSANTQQASDLTVAGGLYWDDFSNSASVDTDLRTSGHYLQSYYGYCYNGGAPTTALTEATGVLGWTVKINQNAEDIKTSDLLWSAEQTPIAYAHVDNGGNRNHGTLVLPYTHAMSKVTINLTANEGFADDFLFTDTVVTLEDKNTVCTVTAPTYTISGAGIPADITMKQVKADVVKTATYSAVMVPSSLVSGELFATITNAGGNKYEVRVTAAMLQKGSEHENIGWGDQLNAGETKSGVHYVLDLTIDKQEITVRATIKDWIDVTAGADGEIMFDSDVTAKGDIADALKTGGFDVYKNNVNTSFTDKTTTVAWSTVTEKWVYDPVIFWAGQSDYSYFRALAPADATIAMSQGNDVLWGYACDDVATDGSKVGKQNEVKINPRTGDVPLNFEHVMSKISVVLNTSTGDDQVDLTNAKISIINLYDKGVLCMSDGNTGTLDKSGTNPYTLENLAQITNQVVIPQSLTKFEDGTDRSAAPEFYQSSELTKIYDDETSLPSGGGEGTYYLTSTLDPVNYDGSELTAIYSDGTSIDDGSTPETYVTATLDHVAYQAPVNYTQAECDELNSPHLIADSQSNAPTDPGYEPTYEQDYTPITTSDVKTPEVLEHYKLNANSVQATTSTFKCYTLSGSSEKHTPGELKSAGNKIMMYVTLNNGSRYSIELSKCTDSSAQQILAWKRGEHYTYQITLGKEQITFRALVKQWDEKSGSGSASLDWD